MILQHNMMAINANRQLNITNHKKADATEKLSSGYRINRAADDAAGLAISEKMRRQIRGLHQAAENIQDGISYLQVADGALNEVHDILHRMNELSVQSANGTYNGIDRVFIDDEIQDLKEELDRIFETTSFNDRKIWDIGSGIKQQIGTEVKQAVSIVSTSQNPTITDANCGIFPPDGFNVNADSAGINISWVGYDGNPYQTQNIDWDTLKRQNYSFDMSDYFGVNDGSNKLYDSNGNPVFQHTIAFTPVSSATINDMIACLNGTKIGTWATVFPTFVNTNSSSLTYAAAYAAGMKFDTPCDSFIEPADANGNILASTSSQGNVISIPSASINNDLTAAQTSTDTWTIKFVTEKIGTATAISNSISYYPYDDLSKNFTSNEYGEGTLGSVMAALTGSVTSTTPGLLSPNNGGSSSSGGQIIINFKLTSDQNFTYGNGQSTNEMGNFEIRIHVEPTDTEQDVLDKIAERLNSTTMIDAEALYANNGRMNLRDISLKSHKISVPIYSGTCGIIIQAGAEADDKIPITYDSLSVAFLGLEDTNALTPNDCNNAIGSIDEALQIVSAQRSTFGAYQNRLEHAYNNNKNIEENTQYAESVLRDTDMAEAMVEYSNLDILQQAGQAVLSQANTAPESVLQLLQEL